MPDLLTIASQLDAGSERLWRSGTVSQISYPEDGNAFCFAVEDSSFWFRHRNQCILESLKRLPPHGTVFDVGGGNGYVARALQDAGLDVVLVEPGAEGAQNALKRGVRKVVQATLDDVEVIPESLPAVCLFDVVEHIPSDILFLQGIRRLMRPGGRLYITVPAYQWLWSHEDCAAGHARRHTLGTLRQTLSAAGFEVEFETYFFSFLPLPILLRRVLPYRLGMRPPKLTEDAVRADHNPDNPLVARLLDRLTRREVAAIAAGRTLRMGGSCLTVARRA